LMRRASLRFQSLLRDVVLGRVVWGGQKAIAQIEVDFLQLGKQLMQVSLKVIRIFVKLADFSQQEFRVVSRSFPDLTHCMFELSSTHSPYHSLSRLLCHQVDT